MASAKPVMRGFMYQRFKRDMIITTVLSILSVTAHRLLVVEPRKQRYAEFYKTYDADAEFERMKEAGIFTSVRPGEKY